MEGTQARAMKISISSLGETWGACMVLLKARLNMKKQTLEVCGPSAGPNWDNCNLQPQLGFRSVAFAIIKVSPQES